jgi:two-component system cell cycle sensor histidine kinase/response regulator CckA
LGGAFCFGWLCSEGALSVEVRKMKDQNKTKEQLIGELEALRQRFAEIETLWESEGKYRSLIMNIPDVIWTTDYKGKTIFISPNIGMVYGYAPQEIYGASSGLWLERIHPDDVERVRQAYESLFERDEMFDVEYRIQRKDGRWIWLRDRAVTTYEENGMMYTDGVFSDITARKQAEEALREANERMINILESISDGFFTVDDDLIVSYFNKAAEWLLSRSSEEVLGCNLFEAFPEAKGSIFEEKSTRAIAEKSFISFETYFGVEPYENWYEVRVYPYEEGIAVYFQVTTERKRAEEELERHRKRLEELVEERTAELKEEITARQRAEEALRERVKELTCLYAVSHDIHKDLSVDELCQRAVEHLVPAMQFPEITVPVIELDGERFTSENYTAGLSHGLRAEIRVEGEPRGQVGVYCAKERPFLIPEQQNLVNGVAEALSTWLERQRAEEAVKRSEATLKSVFRAAPIGIGLVIDRVFQWTNDTLHGMVGYSADELRGRNARMLYPSDEEYERVGREKYAEIAERGTGAVDTRFQCKDGSVIDVLLSSTPLDPTDLSAGVTFTALDITERKRVEEERERLLAQIREQAQRMQHILDTVPEGVLLLDPDERIILVNPVAERELVALSDARTGDTLTHLGDRPLAELLTSPPQGLWHKVAAGDRRFQAIARPIEDGPAPAGWVLVIRDVTQQREIEKRIQQQERLAAVGQLAAGIAHDFNNIMAIVVLYTQMTARMEGLPAIVRERMETINQQTGHATQLIQQILDFSRRAVLERRPLDLGLLLNEHVKLLERTLPESIEIRLDCEPDEYATPFTVNADPTRMQQMVTNLALNARDAMPGGGELHVGLKHIEVRVGESPLLPKMEPGEWVQVTVSDTGTGIPSDVLPHIFEPFFTTRAPLGSGLGLAQVHGIVGQHGGRIDVETQVGRGTTFTIYLPVHPLELSADALPKELPALAIGQGETVLVVEDDANVRKALMESLELLNYRVLEATNGREALAKVEELGDEIGLVLSDVVMPGMSGVALLHALRERGLGVPVVMLTGHPLEKEMEDLRAQGLLEWLPKPPRLEDLAEVMAWALKERSNCV